MTQNPTATNTKLIKAIAIVMFVAFVGVLVARIVTERKEGVTNVLMPDGN